MKSLLDMKSLIMILKVYYENQITVVFDKRLSDKLDLINRLLEMENEEIQE